MHPGCTESSTCNGSCGIRAAAAVAYCVDGASYLWLDLIGIRVQAVTVDSLEIINKDH